MHVLVATHETNGRHAGDYDACIEGEMLWIQEPCAWDKREPDSPCGCSRGFAGMSSHRATTTAMVVDSPLTEAEIRHATRASLADGGWLDPSWCSPELAREQLDEAFRNFTSIASDFPAGTVLRRSFDNFRPCECGDVAQ